MINPQKVDTLFRSCLFTKEELGDKPSSPPDGAILIEGVQANFGFHPDRVMNSEETITGWLEQLPKRFRKEVGGGCSFSEACYVEGGELWTGVHQTVDQLFCLGQAIGKVSYFAPREFWSSLPGGMPYLAIHLR